MISVKAKEDASEMIRSTEENKKSTAEKDVEVQEAKAKWVAKLELVGNLIHDSVPVSNDEVCCIWILMKTSNIFSISWQSNMFIINYSKLSS